MIHKPVLICQILSDNRHLSARFHRQIVGDVIKKLFSFIGPLAKKILSDNRHPSARFHRQVVGDVIKALLRQAEPDLAYEYRHIRIYTDPEKILKTF